MAKTADRAGILYRGNPPALATRRGMDLRCSHCGGTDLKKVSLAYQEGLLKTSSRGRLLGFLLGDSGSSVVAGGLKTRGIQQSELSRLLAPPARWSYLRLLFRFGVALFLGFVAYVIFVIVRTPPVSSLPVKLLVFLGPVFLCALIFLAWRHNTLVFPGQFAHWNRSFLCQRCGTVSQHNVP